MAADGNSSGRGPAGVLTGHAGDVGIAHIKLAPALAAAVAAAGDGDGPRLQVQLPDGGVQAVVPERPGWWPAEWGREEAARPE